VTNYSQITSRFFDNFIQNKTVVGMTLARVLASRDAPHNRPYPSTYPKSNLINFFPHFTYTIQGIHVTIANNKTWLPKSAWAIITHAIS